MDSKRRSVVMERLVSELGSLLNMLDQETVSTATADKMASVRNLLETLPPSGNGSDVYMNSCLYGNGTSFVESLFDDFDCDLHMLSASPEEQKEQKEEKTHPNKSTPTDTPPPLPTTPLPDDYYEEAVPLDPGSTPQYFTTNTHTSRNSVEDAYYEDADNSYPTTRINGPPKNSYNDSDALSSSYESYEEEDEEAKGQDQPQRWTAEGSSDGPVRDCRICAFLLRKKRFGQWAKQLVVVRDSKLQCYKSIKESTPHTELPLNLCNVIYVPKEGRKKRHELRFSLPGGEALVLAVQSKEQAQRWLKVVQDVGSQCSNTEGLDGSTSPIIQRKMELDKVLQSDRLASDSDSVQPGDSLSTTQGPGRDTTESINRGKRGALSELTDSMSRAAGKKINRIITFSKRKPPLPGDPPSSSCGHHDNPRCGYLSVYQGVSWKECWCVVRGGSLYLQKDPGDQRPPVNVVPLKGAEVVPGGLGPKHPFSFCILQGGNELAALEASCSEDLGRWLGVLFAETGSTILPEELHYDYIDVDTLTDIRQAARHSFLWATTTGTSSSSTSSDSRTYDEVYESVAEADVGARAGQVRRHASFSSRDSDKTEQQATIKRHASNVNQYGRYGKTRAEEDARRYLRQEEELEKKKEELRNTLITLRRKKKEVKEEIKNGAGQGAEQQLLQLEALCKQKEEERVELELRLTEVKENLKKSLARGALGPPTDTRISAKAQGNKVEKVYNESLPVNSASELRKRPPSLYASSKGNVMQKAKEWESKKGT
ncbi:actin filament-associated protein 1-like 1 isoform X2 [Thalassophryne amazonica]|uniref:actin filament-associated protein 1-like 1 isoform X2 n=1 Tax=Thalassophryne amazonica TaxID=390379 RepID=UPI0014719B26|nr:actin filament-associated protein 1-like 1 isoform X2 [Thalassophryne amazonica]